MTLKNYDYADNTVPRIFGQERWDCHFLLLKAAFTADVDVLLPTLYLACSDYGIRHIIDCAGSMAPECLLTLAKGREDSALRVNKLVSELPNDLVTMGGNESCAHSYSNPCFRTARYTRLSELISPKFSSIRGDKVVGEHLNHVCVRFNLSVAKAIDNKREQIWAEIPFFYGFPRWEILQAKFKEIVEHTHSLDNSIQL